ncbi:MAG TPA: hypothetical protein VFB20_03455 [Burkholderiales bacterium]|nr:hypothetical protein [Burkholderiales bacterium]
MPTFSWFSRIDRPVAQPAWRPRRVRVVQRPQSAEHPAGVTSSVGNALSSVAKLFHPGAYAGWIERHQARVAALIFLAWMIPGLVGHDPWKPDEGYTFGLVWHVLQTGDWVVPTLAGEPFVEKPPIFFLTAAATAKLFSPLVAPYDGARLACALYIAIACLFTGLASRVMFPPRPVWVAPLLLAGCAGLLLHAHQLVTDNALLAGFAIAIYGLARAPGRPVLGGFWLGTGVGLGFLAKGLLEPGVIGVSAALLPALYPQWRTRRYVVALAAALAVALPWLAIWSVALYLRSPALFVEWFWTNNFGRFFGFAHLGPSAEPGQYLKLLPWFAWPALLPALWAVGARGWSGLADAAIQISTTFYMVMLTVLSLAAEARELYALPLLLPLALLGADGLARMPAFLESAFHRFSILIFTVSVAAVWVCWLAIDFGAPAFLADRFQRLQPAYSAQVGPRLWLAATALTLGWAVAALQIPRSPYRPAMVWTAGVAAVWGLLATLMIGWIDVGMSYRGMLTDLQRAVPVGHGCIASRSLGESQRGVFDYFAHIHTERLENRRVGDDCDLLLVQGFSGKERPPGARWRKVWDGARPGDAREHFWLYRKPR